MLAFIIAMLLIAFFIVGATVSFTYLMSRDNSIVER